MRVESVEPLYSKYSPILVTPDGDVTWSIMGIFITSCDLDSTYYPMDQQTCSIVFTTWGATAGELIIQDVDNLYDTVNTEPYQENGVWELKIFF